MSSGVDTHTHTTVAQKSNFKQFDSLLYKNHALIHKTTVTFYYYYKHNDVKNKSREQGIITTKCVAMQTNHF